MWLYLPRELTSASAPDSPASMTPLSGSFHRLARSATWRTSSRQPSDWRRLWKKDAALRRLCGPTFGLSPSSSSEAVRTWLSAVSPVRTSAPPDGAAASTGGDLDSSSGSRAPFAVWDRATSSWRTCQPSLFGDSTPYSENWPKAGSLRSGAAYERPMLAHRITEIGGGASPGDLMWPTPTVVDARDGRNRTAGRTDSAKRNNVGTTLSDAIRLWSTPSAGNFNDAEEPSSWRARAEKLKEKGINGNGAGVPLAIQAKEATQLWATPSANPWRSAEHSDETWEKNARPLNEQALRFQHGLRSPETPPAGAASSNDTPSSRRPSLLLNPLFVEWLMFGQDGIGRTCICPAPAIEVTDCAPSATPSCPSRPRPPCASSGTAPSGVGRD